MDSCCTQLKLRSHQPDTGLPVTHQQRGLYTYLLPTSMLATTQLKAECEQHVTCPESNQSMLA